MKSKKIIIVLIIVVIIAVVGILGYIGINILNLTLKAVILRVSDKSLTVMNLKDKDIWYIGIPDNNEAEFKEGQEIKAYINREACIQETYPPSISGINEIKILKQKSNIEIPIEITRRVNNTPENIHYEVKEVTPEGITLIIKDTNKYKREYKYSSYYIVSEKLPEKINVKEVEFEKIDEDTVKVTHNWKNTYGRLKEGKYQVCVSTTNNYIQICINIKINESGEVEIQNQNEPQLIWMF